MPILIVIGPSAGTLVRKVVGLDNASEALGSEHWTGLYRY